jgi:hypothetical protein
MKASRLSIRKKDLKMNRRGARIAEEQKNSRGTISTEAAAEEVSATDGKPKESESSLF